MHHAGDPLEEPVVRAGAQEHRVLAGRPALHGLHLVPARADVALPQLALVVALVVLVLVMGSGVRDVRVAVVGCVVGVRRLLRVVRGVAFGACRGLMKRK